MSAVEAIQPEYTTMLVPTEFCPMEWPTVYYILEPAVKRSNGRWTMQDLINALCLGHQQLWIVKNQQGETVCAMTTQIAEYPSRMMLSVQFLGGDRFEEWNGDALRVLEAYAKDVGCHGVEAVGRFGFWPFFKEQGYKKSFCTYESA